MTSWVDSRESFLTTRGQVGRGQTANGWLPGGQPRAQTRRAQPCPKCQAEPGQPCRRRVGGRVQGEDIGGGYWRPIKNMHAERKVPVAT